MRQIYKLLAISSVNCNKIEDFWANSRLSHRYINPNGRQQGIYDEENNIDVKYLGDSHYTEYTKTFCSKLKWNKHIEQNFTFVDGRINSAYNPCHTYLLPDDILSLNREPSKSARQ